MTFLYSILAFPQANTPCSKMGPGYDYSSDLTIRALSLQHAVQEKCNCSKVVLTFSLQKETEAGYKCKLYKKVITNYCATDYFKFKWSYFSN